MDEMQQKLTLERFQREVGRAGSSLLATTARASLPAQNPGFDFSGAEITGNYHDGGPSIPTTQ